MAHSKSAIKAARQTARRTQVNRTNTGRMRSKIKELREAIAGKDKAKAAQLLPTTVSTIDKSIQKGVVPANAAARYKSRLTVQVSKLAG
ncbi:MAG: 30S ribosomal protein S20 [Acidobacteria bacterium]|nr:30S ribosomal protein S20 [Acidobacteriota bacterium]